MSHVRTIIACAGTMLLTSSFFAFGSDKEINLNNLKNEVIESTTEIVQQELQELQVVCTCECEKATESHSEEDEVEETNKINKTKKIKEEKQVEEQTEQTLEAAKETVEVAKVVELKEEPKYITKYVPSGNSFKSYMSYKAITSKSSPQYKLQQQAYTGEYGLRMVEDRYCIALGSYYTTKIGTKVDVVMANGSILKCILGDMKANIHTDSQNIRAQDGSVVEFLIDKNSLHPMARRMGNISYAADKFSGEIKEIRVYQ